MRDSRQALTVLRVPAVLATLFVSLIAIPAVYSAGAAILERTQPVERTLAPGATHRYQVVATAGQFFRVALEPGGIVPTLSVTDPAGHVRETVRDAGDADDPV